MVESNVQICECYKYSLSPGPPGAALAWAVAPASHLGRAFTTETLQEMENVTGAGEETETHRDWEPARWKHRRAGSFRQKVEFTVTLVHFPFLFGSQVSSNPATRRDPFRADPARRF